MGGGDRLEPLSPAFVSVTYGAGGSTRERTHALVERIARETTMKPAAHLTCVGASCDDIREIASRLSLSRRPPRRGVARRPADRLRRALRSRPRRLSIDRRTGRRRREIGDFEVSVGTYPERHPQSPTLLHDIEILKRKVDAGATRAITQFFFDNSAYFRFLDVAAAAGLDVPIVPGSFRCRISSRPPISPGEPGRASRDGSPTGSMASRTIPRRAAWSRRRSAPSRSSTSSTTASRNCISTP